MSRRFPDPDDAMPGTPADKDRAPSVLRIGREPDNDFVVDLPMVSGHHARVVWDGDPAGPRIEDLGSTNGTAIGSPERKVTRAAFSAADTIYLGSHPIAASALLERLRPPAGPVLAFRGRDLVIGRFPESDVVFDVPTVSGRHARLGAIQGTGSSPRRPGVVERDVRQRAEDRGRRDRPGRGRHRPGELLGRPRRRAGGDRPDLAPGRRSTPHCRSSLSMTGRRGGRGSRGRGAGIPWHRLAPVLLLLQAPVIAAGVGLAGRGAPALSWLALAAVWYGLSDVILGDLAYRGRLRRASIAGDPRPLLLDLGLIVGLCAVQCALCWATASGLAGLGGAALPSLGFLVLGSAVGIAAGLAVVVLAPPPFASAALPLLMAASWVLGGEFRTVAEMPAWARTAAGLNPARWAFEGLLLESGPRADAEAPPPGPAADPAEPYFPAEIDRTGPRGAAMALGLLLAGASASAAFIAWASKRPEPARSTA